MATIPFFSPLRHLREREGIKQRVLFLQSDERCEDYSCGKRKGTSVPPLLTGIYVWHTALRAEEMLSLVHSSPAPFLRSLFTSSQDEQISVTSAWRKLTAPAEEGRPSTSRNGCSGWEIDGLPEGPPPPPLSIHHRLHCIVIVVVVVIISVSNGDIDVAAGLLNHWPSLLLISNPKGKPYWSIGAFSMRMLNPFCLLLPLLPENLPPLSSGV